MLGSSASVSNPNIVLNTAVAEALSQFYEELKVAAPSQMEHAVHEMIKRAIRKHKKVVFNGNGYTREWVEEAKRRGLYNLPSTPEALHEFISVKNIDLFTRHHIFTKQEILSRYEILLENYTKTLIIEAKTLQEMLTKDLLPSIGAYAGTIASEAASKKAFLPSLSTAAEESLVVFLSGAYEVLLEGADTLGTMVTEIEASMTGNTMPEIANTCLRELLPLMESLRETANVAEAKVPDEYLPYPTYDQLLFYV